MKSDFVESIHQISHSRYQLPGVMENDAPVALPFREGSEPVAEAFVTSKASAEFDFHDPLAVRIEQTLREYSERVSSWGNEIAPRRLRDHLPSGITLALFGLGTSLLLAVNMAVITWDTTSQQVALSNLGGAVVMMLAGISLFYDRTVRGLGEDPRRRISARQTEEIASQMEGLSSLMSRWRSLGRKHQASIAALEQELLVLRGHQADLGAQTDELRSQNSELDVVKRLLSDEIAGLNAAIQQQTEQASALSRELKNSEGTLARLRYEVDDAKKDKAALGDEIATLEERRTELNENTQRMEAEYDANRAKFERDLDELEQGLQRLHEVAEELQAEENRLLAEKSELVCELDMIRGEYERNAEIASQNLAALKSSLEDLQVEKGLLHEELEQLRSSKLELEEEKSALVGAIRDQKQEWESQQTALAQIQNDLAERKLEQERVVYELSELQVASRRDLENVIERRDAIQVQLDLLTIELDSQTKGVEQNRNLADELQRTIDRLSNVKGAMEVSVDELTQRLEAKSAEHRKKSVQIHDLASRLEHLSDAVKTLSQREAELMRRIDSGSDLPAPHRVKSPSIPMAEAVDAVVFPAESHSEDTNAVVQRVLNTFDDWEQLGLS